MLDRLRCALIVLACAAVPLGGSVVPAVAADSPPGGVAAHPAIADPGERQRDFAAAAREFGVPESVLLAVSYNLTRWADHGGRPSTDFGYGPLDVRAAPAAAPDPSDGRGAPSPDRLAAPPGTESPRSSEQPVDTAARELHIAERAVRTDPLQNIRAGAVLLAGCAREVHRGTLPATVADWYPAVARYAAAPGASAAGASAGDSFADDVFDTLRSGASGSTPDGQALELPADPGLRTPPAPRASGPAPECPPGLPCRFVPAAYDWNSADHRDPGDYGNYDPADRPRDGNPVRYIVIHDTEGIPGDGTPYDQAIRKFQDPASAVSAHYVIRSSDGLVTQLVPTRDIAWHAGNWSMNEQSIGIEHEGYAAQGGTWYTEAMYRASARLVRYLAARYRIPLDREHILGHGDIPRGVPGSGFADAHWDPGPYWDWNHFMDLLGAPTRLAGPMDSPVLTIRPDYATDRPPVQDCGTKPCSTLPAHGANLVYLHTEPRPDSPLITDRVLHPDGSPGTTSISDWSDTAVAGRSYVRAGQAGEWTAIWYGGQRAWFDDPRGSMTVPGAGRIATPKPGAPSIPVYGRAFPEQSAYPPAVPFDPSMRLDPVSWSVPSGQSYVVAGEFDGADYFSRFDSANVPGNHTLVTGPPRYLLLSYNHRYVFVRADDVDVRPVT